MRETQPRPEKKKNNSAREGEKKGENGRENRLDGVIFYSFAFLSQKIFDGCFGFACFFHIEKTFFV